MLMWRLFWFYFTHNSKDEEKNSHWHWEASVTSISIQYISIYNDFLYISIYLPIAMWLKQKSTPFGFVRFNNDVIFYSYFDLFLFVCSNVSSFRLVHHSISFQIFFCLFIYLSVPLVNSFGVY